MKKTPARRAFFKTRTAKTTFVCYLAAACLWLLAGIAAFAFDFFSPHLLIPVQDLTLVDAALTVDGAYVTTTADAQARADFARMPVRRVRLVATFAKSPDEMDLYYGFLGGVRRAFGRPVDGGYEYLLPPKAYESLRVDLGTLPNNTVSITGVELNPPLPFWQYFFRDFRAAAAFLLLPALASSLICTIMEMIGYFRKRKTKGTEPNE